MGKQHKEREDPNFTELMKGVSIIEKHDVFRHLVFSYINVADRKELGKKTPASSNANGTILVNKNILLTPKQWA